MGSLSVAAAPIAPPLQYAAPSQCWVWPVMSSAAQATAEGTIQFTPLYVPKGILNSIGFEVQTTVGGVGSVVRTGLYLPHPTEWRPYDLLRDNGTVSAETTGLKQISVMQQWSGGFLWCAFVVQGGVSPLPSVRSAVQVQDYYYQTALFASPSNMQNRNFASGTQYPGALPNRPGLSGGVANSPMFGFMMD